MNVLILTDFSESSNNAARYAVDFLRDSSANFYMMNIHNFDFSNTTGGALGLQVETTLRALEDGIHELKKYSGTNQHKFRSILSSESLISAVRKTIKDYRIELIFIGTLSKIEHAHPIFGDHAYELVRKIKCNILAIPRECSYKPPRTAVFPVDSTILPRDFEKLVLERVSYLNTSRFTFLEVSHTKKEVKFTGQAPEDAIAIPFTKKLFRNIQKKYDFIVIAGRNLNLCDRLLHSKHGLSVKMEMEIPIFVLHC